MLVTKEDNKGGATVAVPDIHGQNRETGGQSLWVEARNDREEIKKPEKAKSSVGF